MSACLGIAGRDWFALACCDRTVLAGRFPGNDFGGRFGQQGREDYYCQNPFTTAATCHHSVLLAKRHSGVYLNLDFLIDHFAIN